MVDDKNKRQELGQSQSALSLRECLTLEKNEQALSSQPKTQRNRRGETTRYVGETIMWHPNVLSNLTMRACRLVMKYV
jgi:hypothetical protein